MNSSGEQNLVIELYHCANVVERIDEKIFKNLYFEFLEVTVESTKDFLVKQWILFSQDVVPFLPVVAMVSLKSLPTSFSPEAWGWGFFLYGNSLFGPQWRQAFFNDALLRIAQREFLSSIKRAHCSAIQDLVVSRLIISWLGSLLEKEIYGSKILRGLRQEDLGDALQVFKLQASWTGQSKQEFSSDCAFAGLKKVNQIKTRILQAWKPVTTKAFANCHEGIARAVEDWALFVAATFGLFRCIPTAVRRDMIGSRRTGSSPDTGLIWDRARECFETVDLLRIDAGECESMYSSRLDTAVEFEEQHDFYARLRSVGKHLETSSPVQKVRSRRQLVLEQVIDDPEISSAEIARQLREKGTAISDDAIEADRIVVNQLLRTTFRDLANL